MVYSYFCSRIQGRMKRSRAATWAIPLVTTSAAIAASFGLDPLLGPKAPLGLFYLAVAVTALYAGFWPAALAILLSLVDVTWLFVEPRHSFAIGSRHDVAALGLYAVTVLVLAALLDHVVQQAKTAAEARSKKSAELARCLQIQGTALNASPSSVVITDQEGRIAWVNSAFTKLTGYSLEEAVGETLRLLKSGQQPCEYYKNLWKTILLGQVWRGELVNRRKDGSLYIESMSITPVKAKESGMITHFVAIKKDITDRKRVENECAEFETQLRQAQKMEAIAAFAGGIAHDFNNLLGGIIGFVDMARAKIPPDSTATDDLKDALLAAGEARTLANQILSIGRPGDEKFKAMEIARIVEAAGKLLRASIPKSIDITLDIDNSCGRVVCDPTQIHQIIFNLCTNAYHAIGDGNGAIRISCHVLREAVEQLVLKQA